MVRSINNSIPKDDQCLKCGDNLATHATHPSETLGHDLVGFTIGRSFFVRSMRPTQETLGENKSKENLQLHDKISKSHAIKLENIRELNQIQVYLAGA